MYWKKISTILLSLFLLSLAVPVFNVTAVEEDYKRSEFTYAPINLQSLGETGLTSTGYVPSTIKITKNAPTYTVLMGSMADQKFDLRDPNLDDNFSDSLLTLVKNQGEIGSCWSFATFGSLETNLKIQNSMDYDFSESNMIQQHGFDLGPNDGGNGRMATAYLATWEGPVSETNDPYPNPAIASNLVDRGTLTSENHVQEVLMIPDRFDSTDNNDIKSALVNYGAISAAINMSGMVGAGGDIGDIYKSSSSSLYNHTVTTINHGIVIVGWDDTYASSNFYTTPAGNGAFIARNSWGTDWGEAGYFYISYYDTSLQDFFVFMNGESTDNYDYIYSYDELGWVNSLGYNSTTAWFANLFTPQTASEELAAVSFYTYSKNSNYEIYVITDSTPIPDMDPGWYYLGDKGTAVATGTIPMSGYHTIDLSTPILLSSSDYAVIVKLTTPGYNYPVPFEAYYEDYSSNFVSSNKSYTVSDGDFIISGGYMYNQTNKDVCLKAFTNIETTNPVINGASINDTTLVLEYNEALDETSVPATADFQVSNGSAINVTNVSISGTDVTLTLGTAVEHGDTVTLSYTQNINPVQDLVANEAENLTDQAVVNNTPDIAVPVLNSASVNMGTLVLEYNEALDETSIPATTDYIVNNGSVINVTNVAISGTDVTLTLGTAVEHGQTVTLSYTKGVNPIQDTSANEAVNLTNQAVVNNTLDLTLPTLSSASVNDNTLVMEYSEALDETSIPATTDYTVNNGSVVNVTNVSISGTDITLTLGIAVEHGDTVTINYTKGVNPIQDTSANEAVNLTSQAVINNTPDTTAPILSNVGTSVEQSDSLPATSNEDGTIYFVEAPATNYSSKTDLDNAVAAGIGVSVSATANVAVAIPTIGLDLGTYVVYAVDPANNLSAPVEGVTIVDSIAPTLSFANVNARTLVLTYDEALDETSIPSTDDFEINNGSVINVTNIAVSGTTVTLTLDTAVQHGQTVTISYTAGANSLQDISSNYVANLTNQAVTNSTPAPYTPPPYTPPPITNNESEVGGKVTLEDGTSLPVEVDKEGNANVNINWEDLSKALENSSGGSLNINMPSIDGTTSFTADLPGDYFQTETKGQKNLKISTDKGTIKIPNDMLSNQEINSDSIVGVSMGQVNPSTILSNVASRIGDRPLISLSLTVDGKQQNWNNPDTPVTVSIPYTPKWGEDIEHIVVWYIDGSGKIVEVPSGKYDPKTGLVTFSTTHFSNYSVAYVHKIFNDIKLTDWYKYEVGVLGSKGIIFGTSETTYSPRSYITRADYLHYLINTLSLTADFNTNFNDVLPTADYYEAIGIAKELSITNGQGNNSYGPNKKITRQDMMTLTVRALKIAEKLDNTGNTSILNKYKDKSLIYDYAKTSVATLVSEGIIRGFNNMLNPKGNTTRGEAAVTLYRIYNKY